MQWFSSGLLFSDSSYSQEWYDWLKKSLATLVLCLSYTSPSWCGLLSCHLGCWSAKTSTNQTLEDLCNGYLELEAFGTNNFSGPLPLELGNLTKLEQLYFGSSGVSGAIPSMFAALRYLQTVWASDNELTGSIPEFIRNWSKLKSLRFQGKSFGGPIPTTFSNLTLMEDLRISDSSNGSSSLAFLKDMKSLNLLILRNNNISGSIPSNIGDYQRLLQLDFSFNKLTGQIPDSLFNLSSLSYLFLGNNKLTGTLPAQKSTSLLNIALAKRQKLKLPEGCGYEFQMQYGSIGWAVGATLGYAQAARNKQVIASIGDGSFKVTAQDVSTMLRCE